MFLLKKVLYFDNFFLDPVTSSNITNITLIAPAPTLPTNGSVTTERPSETTASVTLTKKISDDDDGIDWLLIGILIGVGLLIILLLILVLCLMCKRRYLSHYNIRKTIINKRSISLEDFSAFIDKCIQNTLNTFTFTFKMI